MVPSGFHIKSARRACPDARDRDHRRALKVLRDVSSRGRPPLAAGDDHGEPRDVSAGADNLRKQVENIRIMADAVIAINSFRRHASEHGRSDVADELGVGSAVCHHFSEGERARSSSLKPWPSGAGQLFPLPLPDEALSRKRSRRWRARIWCERGGVRPPRHAQMDSYDERFGRLPGVHRQKRISPISSDPTLKGAPTGWVCRCARFAPSW